MSKFDTVYTDEWRDYIYANIDKLSLASRIWIKGDRVEFISHSIGFDFPEITKEERDRQRNELIASWEKNGLYGVAISKRSK